MATTRNYTSYNQQLYQCSVCGMITHKGLSYNTTVQVTLLEMLASMLKLLPSMFRDTVYGFVHNLTLDMFAKKIQVLDYDNNVITYDANGNNETSSLKPMYSDYWPCMLNELKDRHDADNEIKHRMCDCSNPIRDNRIITDIRFATNLLTYLHDTLDNDGHVEEHIRTNHEYLTQVAQDLLQYQIDTATDKSEINYLCKTQKYIQRHYPDIDYHKISGYKDKRNK